MWIEVTDESGAIYHREIDDDSPMAQALMWCEAGGTAPDYPVTTVPREGLETDLQLRRRGLLSRKIEDVQLPKEKPSE